MSEYHWRVYAKNPPIDFGLDYPTLAEAQEARTRYRKFWPNIGYIIRRRRGPAVAVPFYKRADR